jgi:hypothetical protein
VSTQFDDQRVHGVTPARARPRVSLTPRETFHA